MAKRKYGGIDTCLIEKQKGRVDACEVLGFPRTMRTREAIENLQLISQLKNNYLESFTHFS